MYKFKFGDLVATKKLGPPQTGTIVGILEPLNVLMTKQSFVWFKEYPDWLSKPVYNIELSVPSKPISMAEFTDQQQQTIDYLTTILDGDQIRKWLSFQYNSMPSFCIVQNPEDDIELV